MRNGPVGSDWVFLLVGLGLSSSGAPIRGRKSFTVRIFSLSLLSMHKWLTILLACIAVLSGGGEVTASASSAVKRSVAVASQPASQEREFRVGRQRLVDSIAEYASNPAHSDCGPETFGRLLRSVRGFVGRCPVPYLFSFQHADTLCRTASGGLLRLPYASAAYLTFPVRYRSTDWDALPETQGVFELSGSAERSGGFLRGVLPQKSSLFPERFIFMHLFPPWHNPYKRDSALGLSKRLNK